MEFTFVNKRVSDLTSDLSALSAGAHSSAVSGLSARSDFGKNSDPGGDYVLKFNNNDCILELGLFAPGGRKNENLVPVSDCWLAGNKVKKLKK